MRLAALWGGVAAMTLWLLHSPTDREVEWSVGLSGEAIPVFDSFRVDPPPMPFGHRFYVVVAYVDDTPFVCSDVFIDPQPFLRRQDRFDGSTERGWVHVVSLLGIQFTPHAGPFIPDPRCEATVSIREAP